MPRHDAPEEPALPSTASLLKSTALAAGVAAVLLVAVVLPAERGVDPTGVGGLLGLTQMGEIKASLAREAAADAAEAGSVEIAPAGGARRRTIVVELAPDAAAEVKLGMAAGGSVRYAWSTDGGDAAFDLHGDAPAAGIDYRSERKGNAAADEGRLEAGFDGSHGWHWRNRTPEPMTITLEVDGAFTGVTRH